MKYIGTSVWSFLLSAMIVYVLGSMSGASFDLTGTFVMTAVFTLTAVIVGDGILSNDDATN